MRITINLAVVVSMLVPAQGCVYHVPNTDTPRATDAFFHDRHSDPEVNYHDDSMMKVAREITNIEDDIHRDGTITVKTPDVWGNGNLMYFLQEFDAKIAGITGNFMPTLQAYIARSDEMEIQGTSGLSSALNNNSSSTPPAAATPAPLALSTLNPFDVIKNATGAAPPATAYAGVGVEPTEMARQQATYIDICQALRRRHMGDDNSRAAGYGLYKFRVPVSVLPGRETHQGYSAVVTLRAQVIVDEAQLRYMYPKLVIADLVDTLTPILISKWDVPTPLPPNLLNMDGLLNAIYCADAKFDFEANTLKRAYARLRFLQCVITNCVPCRSAATETATAALNDLKQSVDKQITTAKPAAIAALTQISQSIATALGTTGSGGLSLLNLVNTANKPSSVDVSKIYGNNAIFALRDLAKTGLGIQYNVTGNPPVQELREFLFSYLGQVQNIIENTRLYETTQSGPLIIEIGRHAAAGEYADLRKKEDLFNSLICPKIDAEFQGPIWLIAVQTGLLETNLRKMLEELQIEGKLTPEQAALGTLPDFHFFNVTTSPYPKQAVELWQTIVREDFPLHVFTLDPEIEEQNAYSAFSRQRELQLALAYNVASGRFNNQQKLAMSRQLQLDEATIALNRTVVGFSHGDDTFGWYFYPRVQAPPPEASNIAATFRVLWSTGPTEHYDLKHRQLDPGMRECEVLIAMPSFINKVSFDVTTNWERLTSPGASKRSYETMLGQGARIQNLKSMLQTVNNQQCYRSGDYARLISRVDQLEAMLGLQTHVVNVPYSYEQSGTDLFDKGDLHLRPLLTGYYGLQYLDASAAAGSGTGTATTPPSNGATATSGPVTVTVNNAASAAATSTGGAGTPTPDTSAHLFLTGKNFHPTLTYVIVGGAESYNNSAIAAGLAPSADVTVINRELIEVKVNKLSANLSGSGFEIRVGTPAGLSDFLLVPQHPSATAAAGYAFETTSTIQANLVEQCPPDGTRSLCFPLGLKQVSLSANSTVPVAPILSALFSGRVSAAKADGTAITFNKGKPTDDYHTPIPLALTAPKDPGGDDNYLDNGTIKIGDATFAKILQQAVADADNLDRQAFDLTVTGYVFVNNGVAQQTTNTIPVHVEPQSAPCPAETVSKGPAAPELPSGTPAPTTVPPPPTPHAPPAPPATPAPGGNGATDSLRFQGSEA